MKRFNIAATSFGNTQRCSEVASIIENGERRILSPTARTSVHVGERFRLPQFW
jgi:hypothetical protein